MLYQTVKYKMCSISKITDQFELNKPNLSIYLRINKKKSLLKYRYVFNN